MRSIRQKAIPFGLIFILTVLGLPGEGMAKAEVKVANKRYVIPGFVEPNTPGAPNVAVDPALKGAITDPAAFDNGELNLNKAIYVRFFDENRTTPPQAILILIPELESGAATFGIIAREVVRQSKGKFEVWSVDRRSNLLEDLEPAAGAWRERTPEAAITALKAYMNNPAGRGGYISNNPTSVTSFMSEWGLDVHLRDLKAIVDQAREATPNVFLGGHSLGSVMTQAFAAYDFEGVPGYQLIKGMVLVGGGYDPGRHSPISDSFYLTGDPVPGVNQIHGLAQLRAGEKPPFFAEGYGFGFVTAVLFQIYDIGVQIALLDPEGTQLYDSGYMSRVIPYRATNAAVMALNMDDEFQYQPIARTSIGFLHIPPGKTLADVAVRVKDDPAGINPNGLWLPRDPGPNGVVHWNSEIRDLRTIGPELRGKEVNRLEDILRQKTPLLDTTGPEVGFNATDTLEWYLPTRLRTDIKKVIDLGRGAISPEIIAAQRERGGNPLTVTRNNLINIPVLGITAARAGMLVSAESFNRYRETTSIPRRKLAVETMEDYTHTDVVSSIAKTSKGSKKNIPQLLVSFIKKNTK